MGSQGAHNANELDLPGKKSFSLFNSRAAKTQEYSLLIPNEELGGISL